MPTYSDDFMKAIRDYIYKLPFNLAVPLVEAFAKEDARQEKEKKDDLTMNQKAEVALGNLIQNQNHG